MKVCPKCGSSFDDDMDFCTSCGERLAVSFTPQATPHESSSSVTSETSLTQSMLQKKGLIIGGAIILILVLGGFWYFKVYTNSPDYIISKMVASSQKLYDDGQNTYYIDKGSLDSTTGNSTEFDLITITKDGITRKNRIVLYYLHKNPNKWKWHDKQNSKAVHDVSYSDFSGYAKDWIEKIDEKTQATR